MAPSIGLNLRVTGYCNQGGRKYMEDVFSVAYQQTEDEKDLEYAYFGIFDGHGGREAALFAKEHLMDSIVRQKGFWCEDDESILKAIHEGFIQTHHAMWKVLDKWPRTASGLPSTAGTTASIAFIRRGKIYIGHVGDSAIVLGCQNPQYPEQWEAQCLTRDHKPESDEESKRIHQCGGKVVSKSGVPRVVWNRPKMGHKGPVRRSTHIDEIPFLAVARSLGDLWSYNSEEDAFVVSPEPDTYVYPIDISRHRCLILGTDGCWNMLNSVQAVQIVCQAEKSNEHHMLNPSAGKQWINPSKRLVDKAIDRWTCNNLRADNTSVVTVMLDPPGPPRAHVLKRQRELLAGSNLTSESGSMALVTNQCPTEDPLPSSTTPPAASASKNASLSIISRFPNAAKLTERNLASEAATPKKVLYDFQPGQLSRLTNSSRVLSRSDTTTLSEAFGDFTALPTSNRLIQCNEISSSDDKNRLKRNVKKVPTAEKDSPRLSRELSALKLDSPVAAAAASEITRGRTRSASASNSDTENEAPPPTPPAKKRPSAPVKNNSPVKSRNLIQMLKNPHFIRSKEAKVNKSASVVITAASVSRVTSSPSTVMSLRPRTSGTTPIRKRKSKVCLFEELPGPQFAAKSPKIVNSKPVMTRSRKARVLQLKK